MKTNNKNSINSYIGKYVIFESFRYGFKGKSLGKIIASRSKNTIEIERVDLFDPITYTRNFDEESITILDTKDEFLARLEF
jgi:hypothetical protein